MSAAGPLPSAQVAALGERRVAGLMTGTSMDGLDIALCVIATGPPFTWRLEHFETVPLPAGLNRALRFEGAIEPLALARLDRELGNFFADALSSVCKARDFVPQLIGSHGQTIAHEHGRATLQLGEPSALALRFGCPVVFDLRSADIAVGGCGAPLVPYVDCKLLGGAGAVLAVNIGGIANFTAVPPAGRDLDAVIGLDCGPGNMVLDELARRFSEGRASFDEDGRLAASGQFDPGLVERLARHPFIVADAPKSAGREQFGASYVDALLHETAPQSPADWHNLFASLTELTARCIADAYRRFVVPDFAVDKVLVSGGGARNPRIMARLAARFAPIPVTASDRVGLPADAKEAIAFAVLASERIDGVPTNMPPVTGARRHVLLGKICEI